MKSKTLFLLLTLALGVAVNAPAAPAETTKPAPAQPAEKKPAEKTPAKKGPPKPYPLEVCIVTDNDLGSMGEETEIVYEGRVIKFCCEPCEQKFLKNPAKYLEKLTPKAK